MPKDLIASNLSTMKFKMNIQWLSALATLILTISILVDNFLVQLPLIGYLFDGRLLIPRYLFTILISLAVFLTIRIFSSRKRKQAPLKKIQFPAKLGNLEFEEVIFTFETNFIFDPKIRYNPSDFADEIYVSEHYVCAKPDCKSVLIQRSGRYNSIEIVCPNDSGDFEMNMHNEFFVLSLRVLGFFKGLVEKDYDKYWNIYKKELKRATNNRLQDFSHRWD